jgi:hypothetical protein
MTLLDDDTPRDHRWRWVDERNAFVCLECGQWDYADDDPEDAA